MKKAVPISIIKGVELVSTDRPGISTVVVKDSSKRLDLSWDRFVRLKAAAEAIKQICTIDHRILDLGGYDGALALFLEEYAVELIDPATTGSSLLQQIASPSSYDLVAAVDVLEHIAPVERKNALQELSLIARKFIVLNYPCRETTEAQKIILQASNNPLIREHVEWELPDTKEVVAQMEELGYSAKVTAHASLAVWLGQYLTLNLAPESAEEMNRYLVERHADEPFSTPLYHMIVCTRVLQS